MLGESIPNLVKAVHNFKGTNNDELCFKKGDIITVTQIVDGGWWEGTLNGVTGWFPSNYVKECKQDSGRSGKSPSKLVEVATAGHQENMKMYRSIVFKDIVDTENTHVNELSALIKNYLHPLQQAGILNDQEWRILNGNIDDILECQKTLLVTLEEVKEKHNKEQRIGGAFMDSASQIKNVHLTYCSNHPKAAGVIESHRDALNKFLEDQGTTSAGILNLTTGLSRPFRRLEKYPALLQELQRHTEESHLDRGDTQRAISVYKDIAASCLNMRRQKEMELEVMSGNIREWEGEDIQMLGDIIEMGQVVFLTEDQERKDRYLVLFPQTLVILSVSPRVSAFIYEGKLPLSGVSVNKLAGGDGYQYAFEITGCMIQRIIVICPNQDVSERWLSLFHQQIHTSHLPLGVVPTKGLNCAAFDTPPQGSPSHISKLHHSTISENSGSLLHKAQPPPPPHQTVTSALIHEGRLTPQGAAKATTSPRVSNKVWSTWSLRPHPPLRPSLSLSGKGEVMLRRANSRRKDKALEEKSNEGDMRILQVIEAYCTSAKTRYTVNSALLDSPQMLIAEEEKIIVEETRGNTTVVEEKSLVDTVYALKDQVKELKSETAILAKGLEEERKARKRLELLLRKHVFAGREDLLSFADD